MECHLQVISSNLQGGAFLFRFAGRARSSGVGAGRFSRTTAFHNRLPHSTQMESPTPCALSLSTTASSGTSCLRPLEPFFSHWMVYMAQQMCGGDAKGGEESDGRSGDARGGGKEKSRKVLQPRMARHREK